MQLMWFVPTPVVVVAEAMQPEAARIVRGLRNQSSDEQFEALLAGRADAAVTAMDNVIAWNRRTAAGEFRIVAQLERTTTLTLVGRRDVAGVAGLRGRSLLVDAPDNGFVIALRALLADAGLVEGSYTMLPAGGVKERFDALLAGRGDATLLGPPFDAMAVQDGLARIACVQDRYPEFPGQGLVVRAAALERLRPVLVPWLALLQAASEQMAGAARNARLALLNAGFPAAALDALLATRPLSLRPDPAGVALLIEQRRRLGLPGADETCDTLVDGSLLPPSKGDR